MSLPPQIEGPGRFTRTNGLVECTAEPETSYSFSHRDIELSRETTTMRRRTAFAPTLAEQLENRLALSHLAFAHAVHVGLQHPAHVTHHHALYAHADAAIALSGTVEGQTPLDGSGTVSPLGVVTSTGTLKARGGEPVTFTGTVTLVGATGSVTATLFGRQFGATRPGEKVNLTYTITGGTGAFQGASGSGSAVFSPIITSPSGDFALTFG
jgi:hypothetical protein